jgi:hypothetical protein
MTRFSYNDAEFWLEWGGQGQGWTILCRRADGSASPIATGLFGGASEQEARGQARELVKAIDPVGIKLVGPDLTRSLRSGDLRIIGPDVAHPNFILWDKDSTSFPKTP